MNLIGIVISILISALISYLLEIDYNLFSDPFQLKPFTMNLSIFILVYITVNYINKKLITKL